MATMSKISEGTTVMDDDHPSDVKFLVLNSTTDSNVTGDGTSVTVEFDTEVYDIGSDFNNTTDTFTAPETGKYILTAGLLYQGATSAEDWGRLTIQTSNRDYYEDREPFNNQGVTNANGSFTISCIADMDAADTAVVKFIAEGGTKVVDIFGNATHAYTFFSGALLA